jgi:hypothetical protein
LPSPVCIFGDLSGGEGQRTLYLDVEHLEAEHAFGGHGRERNDIRDIHDAPIDGFQLGVAQESKLRAALVDQRN